MRYTIAPIYCRPWTLNGITPRLIESHYEVNYGDAIAKLNGMSAELAAMDPLADCAAFSRLKRDELAALNSTLLHELYFASLGGDGRVVTDTMTHALTRDFGSVERWRAEFTALARALANDAGWVLLTYVPRDGCLMTQIATDQGQSIVGGAPILALDMYEHAYHIDFGANADAYIAAFMRNIDWAAVEARYKNALQVAPPPLLEQEQFADVPTISVDAVRAMLDAGTPIQLVDARPRHYSARAHDMVKGAVWRDPERVQEWINELSKDTPVVTFCVYGFHIGCETARTLREAGFDARYMAGGHSGWKASKGDVALFSDTRGGSNEK